MVRSANSEFSALHRLIHTSKPTTARTETIRRHSVDNNFIGNRLNGLTARWGRSLEQDPVSAPWPELADIAISNRCSKNCSFCYRDSKPDGELMDIEDYSYVLDQLTSPKWGPVFQVAIGGGEPTEHPQLRQILQSTRERGIVPNVTTNGMKLTDDHLEAFRTLCGAVALSVEAIEPKELSPRLSRLTGKGIRTNLHFVLSRTSLPVAIDLLKGTWDNLLREINAIVFLTHKAMGRASPQNNMAFGHELRSFLSLIDRPSSSLRFGFDACFVPMLLRFTKVDSRLIDSCECGFFSIFVDERLNVKPCSFAVGDEFSFNLFDYAFEKIWLDELEPYRQKARRTCSISCQARRSCRGPCPYHDSVNLCMG